MKKFSSYFFLAIIFCIAAFFRFYDFNWDQNQHLHPDERFLTMIGVKETLPKNFASYFDPNTSPLNPSNNGFSFFVYGIFPLTLNFLLSVVFHTQTYDLFVLQGRILSGLFDIASIFIIYKIAELLELHYKFSKRIKLFAALFYAISVLPIQLSHFFTVDIFLSFFILTSIYFMLLFTLRQKSLFLILSAASLGLATASKATALAVIPLLFCYLLLPLLLKKKCLRLFVLSIAFILVTYLTTRIADPYLFASANFFDFRINGDFLKSITTLNYYGNPDLLYPPSIQWIGKLPILFSLYNLAFFGLGLGSFLFLSMGLYHIVKERKLLPIILLLWVLVFFFYQSVQNVKTMRYFIFLYPFFAIFAAIGFEKFLHKKNKVFITLSALFILLWTFFFFSIYTKPHTRVTASTWIYQNIPQESTILGEYWDDPLPLSLSGDDKVYNVQLVHVFDPDTQSKWVILNQQLKSADYLILSSNRGWGSIMGVPDRYPQMSKWYKDLFAGKLPFRKIAEFNSFPSLSYLGIPLTIPDINAEESFSVYDHPVVMIFKKQ